MTGLALVGHQFRYDQKAFWRNPASVFFTVMFPVILFLILAVTIPIWVPSVAVLGGLGVWFLASVFAGVIALVRASPFTPISHGIKGHE